MGSPSPDLHGRMICALVRDLNNLELAWLAHVETTLAEYLSRVLCSAAVEVATQAAVLTLLERTRRVAGDRGVLFLPIHLDPTSVHAMRTPQPPGKSLPPRFVVAVLHAAPSGRNGPSSLALVDATDDIVCECATVDPSYLDAVCLVSSWRWVPWLDVPAQGYVEIFGEDAILPLVRRDGTAVLCGWKSVERARGAGDPVLCVGEGSVPVGPRRFVQQHGCILVGVIIARSPVRGLGGPNPCFFVEFAPPETSHGTVGREIIVFQGERCVRWYSTLRPKICVSVAPVRRAVIPAAVSKYVWTAGEDVHIDALVVEGVDRPLGPKRPQTTAQSVSTRHLMCAKNLVNYVGTVTGMWSDDKRTEWDGCIGLDDCVRVFLLRDQVGNRGRGIHVGAVLELWHVHPVIYRECVVGFACCSHSHVHILERRFPAVPFVPLPLASPLDCHRRRLPVPAFLWMKEIYGAFCEKFRDVLNDRDFLGYKNSRLLREAGFLRLFMESVGYHFPERSLSGEFLDHDTCRVAEPLSPTPPYVPTMKELFALGPITSAVHELREDEWGYRLLSSAHLPSMQLVGFLRGSLVDGNLVLQDQTGAIPIATDEKIDPGHLNHVWRFDRFSVAIEKLGRRSVDGPGRSSMLVGSVWHTVYLQLRLSEGACLLEHDPIRRSGACRDAWLWIQSKGPPMLEDSRCHTRSVCFVVEAKLLGKGGEDLQEDERPHGKRPPPLYVSVPPTKKPTLRHLCITGDPGDFSQARTTIVKFHSTSFSVFPAVMAGECYRVYGVDPDFGTSPKRKRGLDAQFVQGEDLQSAQLEHLTVSAGLQDVQPFPPLPPPQAQARFGAYVEETPARIIQYHDLFHEWRLGNPLYNVDEMLTLPYDAVFTEDRRSFFCVIVWKELRRTERSPRGEVSFCVHCRAVEGPSTICLYLGIAKHFLPLGLLPGAHVTFHRVLRKISGKSGRIYAVGTPDTTVTLDRLAVEPLTSSQSEEQGLRHLAALSSTFLVQLWNTAYFSQGILRIRCGLVAIQRVFLSWRCALCHRALETGIASCSPTCTPFRRKFSAEVTCLVDDGTDQALLYAHEDTVWDLFGVPKSKAAHFENICLQHGKFHYQKGDVIGTDAGTETDEFVCMIERHGMLRSLVVFCHQLHRARPSGQDGRSSDMQIFDKLKLRAIRIEEVSAAAETTRQLNKLTEDGSERG